MIIIVTLLNHMFNHSVYNVKPVTYRIKIFHDTDFSYKLNLDYLHSQGIIFAWDWFSL